MEILVATSFAKLATLGISLGFGCIGGQIFPCIYMGTITAMVLNIIGESRGRVEGKGGMEGGRRRVQASEGGREGE